MPKKPQEGVRAVVKRPGEAPVVVRLRPREEFEEMRRIVEGYVSPLFVKDVGCVWVDEEGLPKKLAYNCNGLVGTVVVTKGTPNRFYDLDEKGQRAVMDWMEQDTPLRGTVFHGQSEPTQD